MLNFPCFIAEILQSEKLFTFLIQMGMNHSHNSENNTENIPIEDLTNLRSVLNNKEANPYHICEIREDTLINWGNFKWKRNKFLVLLNSRSENNLIRALPEDLVICVISEYL
jgi:hypothetical protein